jgi:hypothetical protein
MTAPAPTATWLTSDAVANRAQRSTSTVRLAAVTKQLHGHQPMRDGQPVRKGKWIFHAAAVDAWLHGHDARTQATACGCAAVTAHRRRGATS